MLDSGATAFQIDPKHGRIQAALGQYTLEENFTSTLPVVVYFILYETDLPEGIPTHKTTFYHCAGTHVEYSIHAGKPIYIAH